LRQSELFAGNDWLVVYKAFTQVNFNAYDFASIRQAMTDYIRLNYPESFNDWIDSSEFIALIDLVAYLGESLAFRLDINARENFIDTATRRESILRLARFLSYSPQRNVPVTGLVKLTQLRTDDDIFDSYGTNLANKLILWNDPTNPNWFEQWILVLNNSLIPTNPFGTPLKNLSIDGIQTQLYRMNNVPTGAGNYPFGSFVDNAMLNFDVCNADFSAPSGFVEVSPNPVAPFQYIYRSDGNGNASANTGFFFLFKQGILQRSDFVISQPLENRVIYINTANINQNDVWVHTVNDGGYIVNNGTWTRVGHVPTDDISKVLVNIDNITYNSISPNVQNVFQVVTQENDQIMLRFGDGRFGQIPTGNLRVWYRVSANQAVTITPDEMDGIGIDIPYLNNQQIQKNISFTFSLQTTITNGATSETSADIARRAGLNYSTQARMVTGSDYNILPATNNLALKVKAINRVYSGQSRFIDLNDPTGTYQNTNVFSDDGAIYRELKGAYSEVLTSASLSPDAIVVSVILPMLNNTSIRNFLYNEWLTNPSSSYAIFQNIPPVMSWIQSTNQSYLTTGYFETITTGSYAPIGGNAVVNTTARYMSAGALIKFRDAGWVSVVSLDPQGGTGLNVTTLQGPVRLTQEVATGDTVLRIIPPLINVLTTSQTNSLIQLVKNKRSFGISYNFKNQSYNFIDVGSLDIVNPYDYDSAFSRLDSSWIVRCDYSPSSWKFYARGIDFVFESNRDVRFYFLNAYRTVDIETGKAVEDYIKVIKSTANGKDHKFVLSNNYSYSDGYIEPRRVLVDFSDVLNEGEPDNPESFTQLVPANSFIFHRKLVDQNGYDYEALFDSQNVKVIAATDAVPLLSSGKVAYRVPVGHDLTAGTFYVGPNTGTASDYSAEVGLDRLYFQWKHYAPLDQRIDPAVSNIIDIYVLQKDFYNLMTMWRTNGCDPDLVPTPPTESSLRMAFGDLEQFSMFSDQIVWRPAKFKLIFGSSAASTLQLKFKVVPLLGTLVSSGEIKSRLLAALYQFFDVSSWDFGETFYYSELGGYLHAQLVDCIASVAPVPLGDNQSFGDLFEIRANPDELFFPTLQVKDIDIISANTQTNLRIKNA
jgi:hypothetical protein